MTSIDDNGIPGQAALVPRQRFVLSFWRIVPGLLNHNWIENAIVFLTFFGLVSILLIINPDYFSLPNLTTLAQYSSNTGIMTIAMLLVVAIGGIDLSVGSSFALSVFVALYAFYIANLPLTAVFALTVLSGTLVGLVNGVLTGVLGCGALLATLGTMITVRGIFVILSQAWLVEIASGPRTDDIWDFIGYESWLGIPVGFWVLIVVAAAISVMFRNTRFGWHILAVGGNRKAARHGGIPLKSTILLTYTLAGSLVGLSGFLFAARQNSAGSDTGVGLELFVLTGLVVGLGGFVPGRGKVGAALMGFATIFILRNAMINAGYHGDFLTGAMGLILIIVLAIDMKYRKERHRLMARAYLEPATMKIDPVKELGALALEHGIAKLDGADLLGTGQVDGPEDVILDRDGNLYCGTRNGRIMRLFAPDYSRVETYAKPGGRPLGLAFDAEGRLVVCIAGMGLYRISGRDNIERLTSQTRRSWTSLEDDRLIRMADDLDIAPDGRIYFTDATKRYEMETWGLDLLEGRPNGRLLCYDPTRGTTQTVCDHLFFPNGVCVTHDGKHLLVCSTWTCSVMIFDLARMQNGPRYFTRGLPGYPDNINRASDGGYWIALAGMRSPVIDLAMEEPGFRLRMAKRVPPTSWLFGNLNIGGVLKSDGAGRIVDAFWDKPDGPLYMITSMREHRGALFLGGVTNNKIGRIDLDGADPDWTGPDSYWAGSD